MDTIDLATLTDGELEDFLQSEYVRHGEAIDNADRVESNACHIAISQILGEQSRRIDEWIELQRKASA